LVVAGLYSVLHDLFLRDRARVSQRLDDEFTAKSRPQALKSPVFKDLGKGLAELSGQQEGRRSLRDRFDDVVEQSGLALTPQRLLVLMAAAGLLLGTATGILSRSWIAGVITGLIGTAAPFVFVRFKRRRRLDKLLSQLPDALELIGRLIRAGQTISQAFLGVADEFQPPISAEFAYCYEQQKLGLSPDIALRELGQRVGLAEMKIFILGVLVQRQTGGNLAELIDNLATLIRERFRIKGKIRVLTAEGRMEATVLLAMPPVVFGLIYFLNQSYASLLFEHPKVIWGMLGLMLVGLLWIRRIISFDF
jgi:tight adherence protein B